MSGGEQRIAVIFAKFGPMRFYSHLDLLRLFARAARRAGIPMGMTQGFNPRSRIKIYRALKLGKESRSEQAEFVLREVMACSEFKNRLQSQLPEGIELLEVKEASTG